MRPYRKALNRRSRRYRAGREERSPAESLSQQASLNVAWELKS